MCLTTAFFTNKTGMKSYIHPLYQVKKKVKCHKKLSKIISLYIRNIQQLIYIELKSTTDDYLHVGHGLSLIILISNICEINF